MTRHPPRSLAAALIPALLLLALAPAPGAASVPRQQPPDDTLVALHVRVTQESTVGPPIEAAILRAGRTGARTGGDGLATLRLPPGTHTVVATRIGFRPDSLAVTLRRGTDTSVAIVLVRRAADIEGVIVSATRGARRVEDTPLRVEVIDEEEIAEKVAMTPGDISMMLAETGGLRVQATNPSLGGANVRVQGLRGRYSLILADGLPLYGQAGGLGLLQIPPVDLAAVEIIKGTASALHGSAALGGVINLIARGPGESADHTLLANQTTRGGTDAVYFGTGPMAGAWGWTLLAGAHRQRRNDLDGDRWTDMPGYERVVVRPRVYFDDDAGRTAFLTGGFTAEEREGGTLPGGTVPGGGAYREALRTRRADVGGLARWVLGDEGEHGDMRALHGSIVTLRGSAMQQRHAHRFGEVGESDRHRTWFAEAALAVPRTLAGRSVTYIAGAAFQQDAYRAADVAGFDFTYDVPAVFAQIDVDPAAWLALSTSARVDAHSEYGTFVNPRVSLLLRTRDEGALAGWTTRLSFGTGAFAPTPFTEETEATGLTPLDPLSGLVAERARSASLDIGGPAETAVGRLEINATAFASRVDHALQLRDVPGTAPGGASRIALANAPAPTRTWGGELLARLVHEFGEEDDSDSGGAGAGNDAGPGSGNGPGSDARAGSGVHGDHDDGTALRITASYTYLRASECDPETAAEQPGVCPRRKVPLTPRHALGVVAALEQEGRSRLGLELYYTGRQMLEANPYRRESRPYLLVGMLGERAFATRAGVARVFLNLENIGGVRQTRHDPLLLPARGAGGRWTTDAWTDLTGFTANAGVRLTIR